MSGHSDLDAMLRKLKELGQLPKTAAPEVAEAVRRSLEQTIAQGTTAEGQSWKPTKEGKKPLESAGDSLRVTSIGPRIFAALNGHIARHNNGTARGGVQRRILPSKRIPSAMGKAIGEALKDTFTDVMGGK